MNSISDVLKTIRVMTDVFAHKDINIKFARGVCATNGQELWINAGNPENPIWKESVLSKVAHEAGGHIAHTNFKFLNSKLKDKPSTFCSLLNIIEDVRIETKCMEQYSGAYSILQRMTFLLFKEGYWNSVNENTPPENLLFAWLLFGGRGRGVDGQDHLIEEGQAARELLEGLHGICSPVFNKIEKRMDTWGDLATSQAAYQETSEIYILLKQLSQQQPMPSAQSSDESGQSGESGDDSGQLGESSDESGQSGESSDDSGQSGESSDESGQSGESSDESGQSGESSDDSGQSGESSDESGQSGESSDDSGQSGESSDESGQSGESGESSNESGQSGGSGHSESQENVLQEGFEGLGDCYLDFDELLNQIIDKEARSTPINEDDLMSLNAPGKLNGASVHSDITKEANQLSRGIKRTIESQLWAKESQPITYDDSGLDFDDQLLGGVLAGNNRIFFHEDIVESHKSSVMILLDISGSMNSGVNKESTVYEVAMTSALSILQALEELDVDCAMMTFNNEILIAKGWNEPLSQAMTHMFTSPCGGTMTDRALKYGATHFELLEGASERKQIIVITDGQPNNRNQVHWASNALTEQGFDVASIQIMLPNFAGIENYRCIDSVFELEGVLEQVVRDGLLSAIEIV
ncbi:VWA domain-containing protein (plasmid) [Vibrio scophthalmi]|uniref:vWA domain-containing protein n=1 Tax=Vibrio scophthalmi TaxID=45658 RepID=UPI003EB81004